jgi:hypothetical protein
MLLDIAEFLLIAYFAIRYWRTSVPLALGWFLLWAAPPFAEGMRDGMAEFYGVTTSNSVVDIAAIVLVIVLVVGCMMGRWITSLIVGGLVLLVWAT